MKHWLQRWRALDPATRARLQALPAPRAAGEILLRRDRLVVLDLESTGLNPRRDRILSVGAVAVEAGLIRLEQSFTRTVNRPGRSALGNILIHGLTPSRLAGGGAESAILLELLDFLGDSPVFAFHAPFDQTLLRRAWRRQLGLRHRQGFHDLAELAPALCQLDKAPRGLDGWLRHFGLAAEQRHDAYADAFVSAELLLILLNKAQGQGIETLEDWLRLANRQRQLSGLRVRH